MNELAIQLNEWTTADPESEKTLSGRSLTPDARQLALQLTSSRRLEVLELAHGLELRASSWVGRVSLGDLTVTIQPKITGAPLLQLLRYAYRLRDLNLSNSVDYGTAEMAFQDLIVQQLAAEAEELLGHGLHREYERAQEPLGSPRGRIDFRGFVRLAGVSQTTIPCIHYPRSEATLLNRVLLAGLQLAAGVSSDLELRMKVRRLSQMLELNVPPLRLERINLLDAQRSMDRRTVNYGPALTLINLLFEALGFSLSNEQTTLGLSGFLFDMNRFFQALLSQFLREHLEGYFVQDEYRLRDIFRYQRGHNPRNRSNPTPRPDFAVLQGGQVAAVLDAKYRDLWERNLPEEMLYQLAIYALVQNKSNRRAIILYPTLNAAAVDQIVSLHDPVHGSERAQVIIRPVNLLELERLIRMPLEPQVWRRRTDMARNLVFGDS